MNLFWVKEIKIKLIFGLISIIILLILISGVSIAVDTSQLDEPKDTWLLDRIYVKEDSDAILFKKYAEKDLKSGKNVLVVASHNSLRAIVKYIENIPDEKIIDLELPFGALEKYEFDGKNYSHLQ